MMPWGVSPQKERELQQKMERLGIRETDIQEHFIRSSGKGGQNVNKLSTCVYLKHLPTGIEIKCQRERSQAVNRFCARRLLADQIEQRLLGRASALQSARERIRRQKRRRSRKAKEKMLNDKHHVSGIKQQRIRPSSTAE